MAISPHSYTAYFAGSPTSSWQYLVIWPCHRRRVTFAHSITNLPTSLGHTAQDLSQRHCRARSLVQRSPFSFAEAAQDISEKSQPLAGDSVRYIAQQSAGARLFERSTANDSVRHRARTAAGVRYDVFLGQVYHQYRRSWRQQPGWPGVQLRFRLASAMHVSQEAER